VNIVLDGLRVFLAFPFRVGIVETQIALALIVLCQTEVQANRFGMADMQITVGLRRKTCDDAAVFASG
jgi:hypothetical protein